MILRFDPHRPKAIRPTPVYTVRPAIAPLVADLVAIADYRDAVSIATKFLTELRSVCEE